MKGKILITGPTSGSGKYLAGKLMRMGFDVLLLGRDRQKLDMLANMASDHNVRAFCYSADLSSMQQVKQSAEKIRNDHSELQAIILNAGTLGREYCEVTEEGVEWTFAVNYLSNFVLLSGLTELLKPAGTIFIMNSMSSAWFTLDFEDLQGIKKYRPMKSYGRSKTMLLHLAAWIAERYDSIRVYSIDPGTFRSGIARERAPWFRALYGVGKYFMRSPEKAVKDVVNVLENPSLKYPSGALLKGGKAKIVKCDKEEIVNLITCSEQLSGVSFR